MDRPIIFSGPMARALLAGQKTQTRRIIKGVPPMPEPNCHPRHTQKHPAPYLDSYCGGMKKTHNPRGMTDEWCWWQVDDRTSGPMFRVPFVPGDKLWVRETFACGSSGPGSSSIYAQSYWRDNQGSIKNKSGLWYRADGLSPGALVAGRGQWTPSIHMPRWASRLTLHVTGVRMEPLNAISRDDALAEGIFDIGGGYHAPGVLGACWPTPDGAFQGLWESINGARSWEENPWVAVVEFSVENHNERWREGEE